MSPPASPKSLSACGPPWSPSDIRSAGGDARRLLRAPCTCAITLAGCSHFAARCAAVAPSRWYSEEFALPRCLVWRGTAAGTPQSTSQQPLADRPSPHRASRGRADGDQCTAASCLMPGLGAATRECRPRSLARDASADTRSLSLDRVL